MTPAWGRGTPFTAFSSLVHSLPHLLLFFTISLLLFSLALPVFLFSSFVHQFRFYQNSHHSVSRQEVVVGDRTWV